jgi:glycosyltransferase involved in cell wall biosynthesis
MELAAIEQRILVVGNYPPPYGGISIHVQQLQHLIDSREGCVAMVLDVESPPVQVKPGTIAPKGKADFFNILYRTLKESTCVHLHTNGQNYKSWTIIAAVGNLARLTKTTAVLTLHSGDSNVYMDSMKGMQRRLFLGSLKRYDRVIAVNDSLKACLESLGTLDGKVMMVPAYLGLVGSPASLPVGEFNDFLRNHSPVFSTIVFFRPEYGLETILQALAALHGEHPNAGLVIVGSGSGVEMARALISQFGLDGRVHIIRDIDSPEVYAILKESDVFIRATHYDGDSISVREALSLDVPVVATRTDFRPEGVATFAIGDAADLKSKLTGVLGGNEIQAGNVEKADYSHTLLSLYDKLHHERSFRTTLPSKTISRMRSLPQELYFRFKQQCWSRFRRLKKDYSGELQSISPSFSQSFFAGPGEADEIVSELESYPEYRASILEQADEIIAGRFSLLGHLGLRFGDGPVPAWHLDPVNGIETRTSWWQHAMKTSRRSGADPKVIWELNRHQFLITLGIAYQLTRDEAYRQHGCSLISSWINENPPHTGINWASSLELAFRSIAWLWAWQLLELRGRDEMHAPMAESLLAHGEFIANNLSIYYSPNTHITGEALGLLHLGLAFSDSPRGARWAKQGIDLLLHYLPLHVLKDGGYVEGALWYHRYSLEFYSMLLLLDRRFDLGLDDSVAKAVRILADFLMHASGPAGTFPLMGDDDGGSLLHVHGRPASADVSDLFSLLALQFKDARYAYVARQFAPGSLWLIGPSAGRQFSVLTPEPPSETTFHGVESGFSFLRSDWSGDGTYLACQHGPFGWLNCGHAHAHQLSFVLRKGGRDVVTDPGTYDYRMPYRNSYRSPGMHAAVFICGLHPAVPADTPFHWDRRPKAVSSSRVMGKPFQRLTGTLSYPGRKSLNRTLSLIGGDAVLVEDIIDGRGEGDISLRFPLGEEGWQICGPGIERAVSGDAITWASESPLTVSLSPFGASRGYGDLSRGTMCRVDFVSKLPAKVVTLIDVSGKGYRLERTQEGSCDNVRLVDCNDRVLLESSLNPFCG